MVWRHWEAGGWDGGSVEGEERRTCLALCMYSVSCVCLWEEERRRKRGRKSKAVKGVSLKLCILLCVREEDGET
jgi:hypothetical protein